jgi:hypothetical protein
VRFRVKGRTEMARCGLTLRWSGRGDDKVPFAIAAPRAAQLNR